MGLVECDCNVGQPYKILTLYLYSPEKPNSHGASVCQGGNPQKIITVLPNLRI